MKGKSVGTWLSEKQLRYQPTEDDFLRGKEEHVLYWSVRPKSVSLFLNIIPEQQPQNHASRECDAYRDTTVARIQIRPLKKQLRTALYHYGPKRGRTSSFDSLFQHHQLSVLLLDDGPGVAFDLHDTTSPWIFAAFATITAPIAFLLNTLTILAVKQKMELRQRLSCILLSSMAVSDLLIGGIGVPLSAILPCYFPIE